MWICVRDSGIGPSGPKGPIWPIGRRVEEMRACRKRFPENPHIFALIHVRIAEPLNFRGSLEVISPIRTKKAPGPNPRYGPHATHRILTRENRWWESTTRQCIPIMALNRALAPYESAKLPTGIIENGAARLSLHE